MRHLTRALCAFLLFLPSWLSAADTPKSASTILVVARSELPDPNFKDATVLVMNNLGVAPVGVIINRPTRIPVSKAFPEFERLAKLDDKLYFGGPVQIDTVSFLFRAKQKPEENAAQVLDGVYLSSDVTLLKKLLARDKPMEGLRIFIGYSGWAPGQLEAEIERGDWKLAAADADAVFTHKSEHPWPERESSGEGRRI